MRKKLPYKGRDIFCLFQMKNLLMLLMCFAVHVGFAQTLISPTGDGGFETGTTFANNGWFTANQGNTNRVWYCGTGQTGFSGSRAAFIGNTTTTVGSSFPAKVNHLYRSVTIPSGATNIVLTFKYKQATLDATFDNTKVFLTSATPVAGTNLTTEQIGNTEYPGASALTVFTTQSINIPVSYAGTTKNLVFSWKCDSFAPDAYGAVDDISLTYTAPATTAPTCASGYAPANATTAIQTNPTFTWSAASGATSYDVYFGTSSTPPFVGNVSTASYYHSAMLSANTTYYWSVVPKNSFGTATGCTTQSFTTGASPVWCTPTYANGCLNGGGTQVDIISKVVLNTLSNTSTCGGYLFYNSTTIPNLGQGQPANIAVTVGNDITQFLGAWIDFNQNGIFESTEGVVSTSTAGANGTANLVLNVPAGAVLGNTRMRIRGGDDVAMTTGQACGATNDPYGETEDYIVNITAPLPLMQCATLNSPANNATNITNFTLSWTPSATGPAAKSYVFYVGTTATPEFFQNTTATSMTITGYTSNTLYYWKIVPKSALATDPTGCATRSFTTGNPFLPYCYSGVTYSTNVEPITLVTFAGINRASSNVVDGSPALENYIADIGSIATNATYTMTLKGNTNEDAFGPYTSYFRVFIDWNQDGDFSDAGESIDGGSISNSTGIDAKVATKSITVPSTALAGTTRMRIKKIYSSGVPATWDACTGSGFGQSEDYSLSVCVATMWYADNDNDGFGNNAVSQSSCTQPTGYVSNNTDCNDDQIQYLDTDGDGFGSTTQVACGVITNNDCNDAVTYYTDNDADGFGALPKLACGTITNVTDCNDAQIQYLDADGDGFGSTTKVACGVVTNDDCNDAVTYYTDNDGDGFGALPKLACSTVTDNTDCNDAVTYYTDSDGDGFGVLPKTNCGTVTNNIDCNDAQLLYTDVDADGFGSDTFAACAGVTNSDDCNDAQVLYTDLDADGFGSDTFAACTGVSNSEDCDDAVILYTDADADGFGSDTFAACNGVANPDDCNDAKVLYSDVDADGFGSDTKVACAGVANSDDCNDNLLTYVDADNDNHGSVVLAPCGVSSHDDCNDANSEVYPGHAEIGYNLIDDDCDGAIDEGFTPKSTTMQSTQCGNILATIDTQLFGNLVAGAQGYRWKITTLGINDAPVEVQEINTQLRVLKLTQLPHYAFDTKYKVEIAVYYAGFLQPYASSSCTVTTPSPTTSLAAACGKSLTSMPDVIYANIVPFATGYRFEVTEVGNPANTQTIDRPLREFRMNLVTAFTVRYGKTYQVRVAVRNTDGSYLGYGSVCTVSTPVFPTTFLQDAQCSNYAVPNNATQIYAYSYPGAISYVFNLSLGGPETGVEVTKNLRTFSLSDFAGQPLIPGATYNLRVRLVFNNVDVEGPYGKACTISLPGSSRQVENAGVMFDAVAWPNPSANDFNIDITTAGTANVSIKVYDMTGRMLENKIMKANDLEAVKIGSQYPSGVYNVIVSQGEEVKTLRVVKR
jgi:hypothetical protein